jgi:ABC-type amino acid transport system permease subunit
MAEGVKTQAQATERSARQPVRRPPVESRAIGVAGRVWRSVPVRARIGAFIIIMTGWQIGVANWGKDYMATPLGVLAVAPEMLTQDEHLWDNTRTTLVSVAIGLGIGGVVAVLVGIAMGRIRTLEAALGPYVNGLYATPMIAILPVFTLWFGFSNETRLALVLFAAFPPLAIGAWDGSRSVSKKYLEVAHTFGATPGLATHVSTILRSVSDVVLGLSYLTCGREPRTGGGTRTPNRRFWRPVLCQIELLPSVPV